MSSPKFSGERSARREVLSYRQSFALTWQRFIIQNFDSPAHAAHGIGVYRRFSVGRQRHARWLPRGHALDPL